MEANVACSTDASESLIFKTEQFVKAELQGFDASHDYFRNLKILQLPINVFHYKRYWSSKKNSFGARGWRECSTSWRIRDGKMSKFLSVCLILRSYNLILAI